QNTRGLPDARGRGLARRGPGPASAFAAVRPAVRDHRPAVVLSSLNDVDLVAAKRSILRVPDLAGLRVDDQTARVTNAEGIDLGLVALPAGERIISWRASIVLQAQDFAGVVGGL